MENYKVIIGQGSCGIAAGAAKVEEAFKDQIAAKSLSINLEKTGCIGTCYHEHIVDVVYH